MAIKEIKFTDEEKRYLIEDDVTGRGHVVVSIRQTFQFENKFKVIITSNRYTPNSSKGEYLITVFDGDNKAREILGINFGKSYTEDEVHNILKRVKDFIDLPKRNKEDIEADSKVLVKSLKETSKAEPIVKDSSVEVNITKTETAESKTKRTRKKKNVK